MFPNEGREGGGGAAGKLRHCQITTHDSMFADIAEAKRCGKRPLPKSKEEVWRRDRAHRWRRSPPQRENCNTV